METFILRFSDQAIRSILSTALSTLACWVQKDNSNICTFPPIYQQKGNFTAPKPSYANHLVFCQSNSLTDSSSSGKIHNLPVNSNLTAFV